MAGYHFRGFLTHFGPFCPFVASWVNPRPSSCEGPQRSVKKFHFFPFDPQCMELSARTFPIPSVFRRWEARLRRYLKAHPSPGRSRCEPTPGPGDAIDLPRRRTRLSMNKDPHPISTWKAPKSTVRRARFGCKSNRRPGLRLSGMGRRFAFVASRAHIVGRDPIRVACLHAAGRDLAQSAKPQPAAGRHVYCAACMPHVTRLRQHAYPRPVALTLSSRFCDGRVKACHPLQEHGSYSSLCPRPLLGLSCFTLPAEKTPRVSRGISPAMGYSALADRSAGRVARTYYVGNNG